MSNNTKIKRSIFILGDRHDFLEILEEKFYEVDREFFEYQFVYGDWSVLVSMLESGKISMLIVDFSNLNKKEDIVNIANSVAMLKKDQSYESLPVVGLFDNKKFVFENNFILFSGLNYFHVIGDDLKLFFGNIVYLVYEDNSYLLKLARSIKLNVTMNAMAPLLITSLSDSALKVDSDFTFNDSFNFHIDNQVENKVVCAEVIDSNEYQRNFPTLNSYLLDLSFGDDSWSGDNDSEEDANELMQEDEFSTIIHNLTSDNALIENTGLRVFLFSKKQNWFYERNIQSVNDINFFVFNKFEERFFIDEANIKLIIFECCFEEDLDELDELLTFLSNSNFNPIMLILNHPSKAEALKKMYDYDQLITYKGQPNLNELSQMFAMIRKSATNSHGKSIDHIKESLLGVNSFQITVTSLSENEITFKSNIEIPFFSHILLNEGDKNFLVTVMPSFLNLSPNLNGFHYMGFFNLTSEDERILLRNSVKRYLNDLPVEWSNVKLFEASPEAPEETVEPMVVEDNEIDSDFDLSLKEKLTSSEAEKDNPDYTKKRKLVGSNKSKL